MSKLQSAESHSDMNSNDESALEALRNILLRQHQAELDQVKEDLQSHRLDSQALSELLPSSVRLASEKDDALSRSMAPLIGDALHTSIKNNPKSIVEAISPIMGPAIRDSIRQALQGMVQSLNKTLEYSVSAKGLGWRWEAFKTGKSFAEVVLVHTLLYRVVQVFLVHRETGLLIQHAALDENVRDADLASGMLTAIQDFARDSLGAGDDESLREMAIGNQTIWIETGPIAYLAIVIEGEPPADFYVTIRECVETIHVEFAEPLSDFDGDSAPLAGTAPLLADCLVSAFEHNSPEVTPEPTPPSPSRRRAWIIGTVCGLALLAMLLHFAGQRRRLKVIRRLLAVPSTVTATIDGDTLHLTGEAYHHWIDEVQSLAPRLADIRQADTSALVDRDANWLEYLRRLRHEPTIIVTQAEGHQGTYSITGIFDPTGTHPDALLQGLPIPKDRFDARWTPIHTVKPESLTQRMANQIELPQGVHLKHSANTIQLSGNATLRWLDRVKSMLSEQAPKIELDTKDLKTVDVSSLDEAIDQVERQATFFLVNSAQLDGVTDSELEELAESTREIVEQSRLANRPVQIVIVGHSGPTEQMTVEERRALATQRARYLWNQLTERGAPQKSLLIRVSVASAKLDLGIQPSTATSDLVDRCCTFEVMRLN